MSIVFDPSQWLEPDGSPYRRRPLALDPGPMTPQPRTDQKPEPDHEPELDEDDKASMMALACGEVSETIYWTRDLSPEDLQAEAYRPWIREPRWQDTPSPDRQAPPDPSPWLVQRDGWLGDSGPLRARVGLPEPKDPAMPLDRHAWTPTPLPQIPEENQIPTTRSPPAHTLHPGVSTVEARTPGMLQSLKAHHHKVEPILRNALDTLRHAFPTATVSATHLPHDNPGDPA